MNKNETLAARFFFRNCSVSIYLSGGIAISFDLTPEPEDVVIDRDLMPMSADRILEDNQFADFLCEVSQTNDDLIKKINAIGCMLCNKLPRDSRRNKAFICVNAKEGDCANGKSLFARGVSELCNSAWQPPSCMRRRVQLSNVTERTNLLVVDGVDCGFNFRRLFNLCTDSWWIESKAAPTVVIPREKAPYLLITSQGSVSTMPSDLSFKYLFEILEFSLERSQGPAIINRVGIMFDLWTAREWSQFYNFMFWCVVTHLGHFNSRRILFESTN